jgi:hypothetical protein
MKYNDNTVWRWFADKKIAMMKVHLWQVGETPTGKLKRREIVEFSEHINEEGAVKYTDNPTLILEYEEAQQVIQELWNLGFRPAGVESSNEYVQSLKDHIATLQAVNTFFMEVQKADFYEAMNVIDKHVLEKQD